MQQGDMLTDLMLIASHKVADLLLRATTGQDDHGSSTSAARNFGAIETLSWTRLRHQLHQAIGSSGPKATGAITGVCLRK